MEERAHNAPPTYPLWVCRLPPWPQEGIKVNPEGFPHVAQAGLGRLLWLRCLPSVVIDHRPLLR
jgi:hypothetical protein